MAAMGLKKVINPELEVTFSKRAQPVWFRILEYILLAGLIYRLGEPKKFLDRITSYIYFSPVITFFV
jgi:hypothetical protein